MIDKVHNLYAIYSIASQNGKVNRKVRNYGPKSIKLIKDAINKFVSSINLEIKHHF